ncbi:MAG: ABC transporter substrate-binding protein [Phycisphaerae bacterium]|nr:ABC transporter substrate-binding protein [Phycisphaerae bacterium]
MTGTPPRIVSLLPSATEIVAAIGAGPWLVGRSHECDHPAGLEHLPVLTAPRAAYAAPGDAAAVDEQVRRTLEQGGALYHLDADRLAALRPDVIITQDLCRVCSIDLATVRRIAAALRPAPRIVSLNPTTLEGVLDDVLTVGRELGIEAAAQDAVAGLRERLYAAQDFVNPYSDGPSVALLEWTDPLFIGGHWTPQLIERAGGRCPLNPTVPVEHAGAASGPIGVTQRTAGRSRQIAAAELVASAPEAIVIAPCGLTLEQTRAEAARLAGQAWWRALPAVRRGRVALVDGNRFFNRPGPRLVDAFEFLVGWLNDRPELIPAGFAWEPMRA